MAKILKFGTISETEDGQLHFKGFHIDCNNEYERGDIAILSLTRDRIIQEINEILKIKEG